MSRPLESLLLSARAQYTKFFTYNIFTMYNYFRSAANLGENEHFFQNF